VKAKLAQAQAQGQRQGQAAVKIDTKAATVVRFSDGKVLYTVSGKPKKYGFPKGDIETLEDPPKSGKYRREGSKEAALRELMEETGFHRDNTFLKRTVNGVTDPKFYTILGEKEVRQTIKIGKDSVNCSYYILQLKEKSTDPGPDLSRLTANAVNEKIDAYEIVDQYDPSLRQQQRDYNQFSSFRF
jgi:8-oxo-dGTP pyrophosphatase MutT (NUDIX family)